MPVAKKPNVSMRPLFRRLGPEFDSFARRGTMLLHSPVKQLLGGFHFDARDYPRNERWLYFFVQPLYIPEEVVTLGGGWRLPRNVTGGTDASPVKVAGTDDDLDETIKVMLTEGLPSLNAKLTLESYLNYLLHDSHWRVKGQHIFDRSAATAILAGDYPLAASLLAEASIAIGLETRASLSRATMQRYVERIQLLRDYVTRADLEGARNQLSQWRAYTARNLGIEDLLAQSDE
jgi:hypothetical protein